jgi:acetyl esterase/lipase/lysophospholipase L1-like esterase
MNTLKFKILSLLLLFICHWAIGQNLPRFKFPVYTAIDSLKNIQYGEAINLKGEAEKLLLDIYAPSADTMKKRPLVVFVHGGGFQTGDKASGYPLLFSKGLAQRGYVCSSINYRLGVAAPQNDTNYIEAMYRAVQDAKAAVRFFRKNAAQYGIDTTQIFIMGGSAGGMTVLQMAYLDQHEVPAWVDVAKLGSIEGNSGNPGFSSRVKAVVNCWGAMIDYRWINAGDVPVFNVHGTADKIVPYDSAFAYHRFKYGSNVLFERALSLGISTGLKVFENTGHTLDNDKTKQTEALDEIGLWLYIQLNRNANTPTVFRYEKDIQEFERLDQTEKYSSNAILFSGSSFIRLWKSIHKDLAPHEIIHRGYGGSNISEMAYYVNRIVYPHPCKAIVFYTGSNDITGSKGDKSPLQVLETFKYVVKTVRKKHPTTPIYWIEISPNESRWPVWDKITEANTLLKNYCANTPNLHFIETASKLLGKDGLPQKELYVSDRLHFNEKGYKIWTKIMREVLAKMQ